MTKDHGSQAHALKTVQHSALELWISFVIGILTFGILSQAKPLRFRAIHSAQSRPQRAR